MTKTVPAAPAATENTDTATPTVPAMFLSTPAGASCERYPWCVETGPHANCYGPEIGLPTENRIKPGVLAGQLHYDAEDAGVFLLYQRYADWQRVSANQLRAETDRIRAHAARLDALADQYDAITEAGMAGLLHRAAACVAENGASPELADFLGGVADRHIEDGDHDGAGSALANALTASPRRPEQVRYGCTPNCVMDHAGEDGEPGWHKGATVELPAPSRYSSDLPGQEPEPLLAARVTTVNDQPNIFGIATKLWVDVPGDTMELTLPEVDRFIAGLEAFIPRLRALRAELVEIGQDDRPENPEAKAHWRAEVEARAAAERDQIAHEADRQGGEQQ